MKQHIQGPQLKELDYEDRITLLSLATGLTREYMKDEYKKEIKQEDAMLLKFGYDVKVGEMIEIVEDFTGKFPTPVIEGGKYSIKISGKSFSGSPIEIDSQPQPTYCDALFEVVKALLKGKYISVE